MSTTTLQLDLHQDCLDKLSQILDLVLKSAEAASADNNHKVVIQAAREATRITALMFKLTNPKTKTVSAARSGAGVPANKPAAAALAGETDIKPEELILPDLDTLFPPHEVASWDSANQAIYNNFTKNYREFQDLCDTLAAGLPMPGNGNGTKG